MEEYLLFGSVAAALMIVGIHDLFVRPPWRWGIIQFTFWIAAAWAAYIFYTSDGPISVEAIVQAAGLLAFGAILLLRALYIVFTIARRQRSNPVG